jgi:AhpD family alkylhydroperoxidase
MDRLSTKERELTAIGAAIASNCIPCIEYHVPQARNAGLSDSQILEAVRLADKVRQTPARKVLETAKALLEESPERDKRQSEGSCEEDPESTCCETEKAP